MNWIELVMAIPRVITVVETTAKFLMEQTGTKPDSANKLAMALNALATLSETLGGTLAEFEKMVPALKGIIASWVALYSAISPLFKKG